MTWPIAIRIISVLCAVGAAFIGFLLANNSGALDATAMLFLGATNAALAVALAILPSATNLSSLKPEREQSVVRNAVRNVAPLHPSAARGAPLPIETVADKTA